jgi:hypothetical protein
LRFFENELSGFFPKRLDFKISRFQVYNKVPRLQRIKVLRILRFLGFKESKFEGFRVLRFYGNKVLGFLGIKVAENPETLKPQKSKH